MAARYDLCILQRSLQAEEPNDAHNDEAWTLLKSTDFASGNDDFAHDGMDFYYTETLRCGLGMQYALGVHDVQTKTVCASSVTFTVPTIGESDIGKKTCTKTVRIPGGCVRAKYVFHKRGGTLDLSSVYLDFNLGEVADSDELLAKYREYVALRWRNAAKRREAAKTVKTKETLKETVEMHRANVKQLKEELLLEERKLAEAQERLSKVSVNNELVPGLEPEPMLF